MEYDIREIAAALGCSCEGLKEGRVSELLTDSRRLSFPEGTLFFAIPTASNDGHRYIRDLYGMRVRNFVVNRLPQGDALAEEMRREANFLVVPDTVAALQKVAAMHRGRFPYPVVGITGSNGKTLVKEFLYQLLGGDFNIVRSPRSYNSRIGVPLSVWKMAPEHTLALFEAGISMPGEMDPLREVLRPQVGVLTNVGAAHQDNFPSLEAKALEKLRLFRDSQVLVACKDSGVVREAVEKAVREGMKARLFWWSRRDPSADLYVKYANRGTDSTCLGFVYDGRGMELVIPFTDEASVEDVICCIGVICCLRPQVLERKERFAGLEPVEMRLEVKQGRRGNLVINDSYNSDINSLEIALDFQAGRRGTGEGGNVLVLSDILQSGMPSRELYSHVARIVAEKGVDTLVGIGAEISANADLFGCRRKEFYRSTEELLSSGTLSGISGAVVLLKGARDFHFERIAERLEKKLHETILEVNLDALVHNYNTYRSKLKPQTKMVCMVKAFAYGAGSFELAKTLQEHRCDYLAVAVADEGVDLRKEGITMPIMVMNPEMNSLNLLFEYSLEPEVYSFRLLDALVEEARRAGVKDFPIHLKVDTGMHRLGFLPEEFGEVCRRMNAQKELRAASLFSHFAGSDSEEFDDFTRLQLERYDVAARTLRDGLGYGFIRHILNTAGIERFTSHQMEMVRLGIGLYGISASGMPGLKPVSTLKTTVLQIKTLLPGETVGYSRRGVISTPSRIAVIPIGYADGLNRRLGNGCGEVVVNGRRCPIVGNICMDACMVDVTGTDAAEGDTVVVFGEGMPVEEVASRLGTIPYEVLTSVSPRVKRIYYHE